MSSQNYIDKSREALKYFHNESCKYSAYGISFDELLLKINRDKESNINNFLTIFGKSIVASELSTSEIKSIMENLAKKGQGRIPYDSNVFFQALISEVQNIDWVSIVSETASDIAGGVQSFGDNVLFTMKSLNAIFPFLIIGGLVYIAITRIKKVA
jgi:hypothetical protein